METLKVRLERRDRAGKTVTVVSGFTREKRLMEVLAVTLKRRLGCGGTFTTGAIELQGDMRERVRPILRQLGFVVKG